MKKKIIDCELRVVHKEARNKNFKINKNERIYKDVFSHKKLKSAKKLWSIEKTLDSMKKNNIKFGLLSPLAWNDEERQNKNNRYVNQCLKKYDKLFKGFYIPYLKKPKLIEKKILSLNKKNYVGIEIIPKWQNIKIDEINFDGIANAIIKKKFFLKIYCAHPFQNSDSDIFRILRFKKKYPKLKIILPHLGGLLCLWQSYPPLRKEISKINFITSVSASMKMVKFASELNFKNLIFGTDFPFNHSFDQKTSINNFLKLKINSNKEKYILEKNANRLFGFYKNKLNKQ